MLYMLFTIPKMIVSVDDAADAIAALRATIMSENLPQPENTETPVDSLRTQLETGSETVVNPDGSTNPSSTESGEGYKPVGKAVVAADTADAIAALREQLAGGGETMVNQDGTVLNPADPMSASSLANRDGFKPVDKAVVAADTADMIASLRDQLVGGDEIMVDQDGTVLNPADSSSASSLANGDGFKPVDKAVVAAATQWYQTNPALQKAEIKAMADIHPDAKMGYLPNGRMYWTVRIHPVVCGKRKDWTLLAVYDPDHPQKRWGGSVKFYPVKPNYNEMMQLVNQSHVTPKTIPHLLRDEDNQIYMCTQDRNNIRDGQHKGELVTTAAACLRFAMRWITVFELGLIDQKTWSLFQEHGKI